MANNSRREDILLTLKTKLEEITDLATVVLDKGNIPSLDIVEFPVCFIFSDREYRVEDDRAVIGYETFLWTIILEIHIIAEDLENMLGQIHDKLYVDRYLDGYAVETKRMGVDIYFDEVNNETKIMMLQYDILYRVTKGKMLNEPITYVITDPSGDYLILD
jgi:hypothetical protein